MNAKTKQTTEEKDLSVQTDFLPTEESEVSEPDSDLELAPEPEQEEFDLGETKVIFKEEGAEYEGAKYEGAKYEEEQPMAVQPDARVGSDFWNEDDWVATGIGETPEGNIVQVKKRQGGSGYELGLRNGGVLPAMYSGWYTSYDKARDAGNEYLNTLESKSA